MLLQRREPYFDAAHSQVSSYFILQEEDDADGPPPMSHEVTITTQQEYEEESQTSPMKQDSFNEEDDSTSNNRSIANENVIRNNNNNKQANPISLNNEDPEDSGDEPCDLTSLSWLQNITNIMSVPALPTPPDSPDPNQNNARAADGTQPQPERTTRSMKLHQSITRCHEEFRRNQQLYATRDSVKPPFSYATMICMAMRENGNKMTLSEIYAWIKESFVYYRKADPSWQNSIRHNLSLNKVFVKVARSKDERGKGGFWQMDPDRLQERRRFKKRSVSDKEHVEQPLQKTRKRSKIGNQVQNTANKVNSPPVIENLLVFNDIYPRVEIQNMAMPLLPQLTTVDASEVDVEDSLPLLPLDSLLACTTDENHQNTVEVQSVQHGMQVGLAEDELTNLLLSGGWDDSQLELLDSLLDSL